MNHLELRSIGANDWARWREVRQRALGEAPHAFSSLLSEWTGTGDTETRWRSRLDAVPLNVIAVVETGEGPRSVGQVSGTAINDAHEVELISLWVAPEVRGQGVAAALIDAVIRWATDQGARRVVLGVKRGNAEAIAAYERAGFRRDRPAEEPAEWRMGLELA